MHTLRVVKACGACITSSEAARHLSKVLRQDQSIVQDMPPALLGVQPRGFVHGRCVAGRLQHSCLHGLSGAFEVSFGRYCLMMYGLSWSGTSFRTEGVFVCFKLSS